MSATSRLSRRITAVVVGAATVGAAMLHVAPAHAAGASTITGAVFQDLNRNGVQDAGEAPFANITLYLYDSTGTKYLANTTTGTDGRYSFAVADGSYQVGVEYTSWTTIRDSWVPTTTPLRSPLRNVTVSGSGTADFGWRPIVRSTTLSSPISSYTAASGLKVNSYDDAVSAADVYDTLMQGSLFGAEMSHVTIRFDYDQSSATSTSVAQDSTGAYTTYAATSSIAWSTWLDNGEQTLTHEYGHAWSLYNAYIVQQDPSLAGYLAARGLSGDSRVGSSYMWSAREMIAEDYRQLFGSPTAAAAAQMNYQIPPASQVPGLADYLKTTFTQPPSGSGTTTTTTTTTSTPPAVTVTGLGINPQPVSKSGTVSCQLSLAATVTITIATSKGAVVRTLLANASEAAGSLSVLWDRKDSSGSRVKTGTYTVAVTATDAYGRTGTASTSFSVQ